VVVSVEEDAHSNAGRLGSAVRHALSAGAERDTASGAAEHAAVAARAAAEDSTAAALVHAGVVVSVGRASGRAAAADYAAAGTG
jgi:hypothetical protein